jgi:hypothetical protein
MKEAIAVTGFVPDHLARTLAARQGGAIDIRPERGLNEVVMRVDGRDVDEVRTGASTQGETLVQLILRPDAPVQTVINSVANPLGLARLQDPILSRLTASATPKSILV